MFNKLGLAALCFCGMLLASTISNTFWYRNALRTINYQLGHYRDLGTSVCGVGGVSRDEGGKVQLFDINCAGGMISYSRDCNPLAENDCLTDRVDFDKVQIRDIFTCQVRRWVPLIGGSGSARSRQPHHCSPVTERIRRPSI